MTDLPKGWPHVQNGRTHCPRELLYRGEIHLESYTDGTPVDGKKAKRRFKMEAYTGARVSLGFCDLVLDMAGLEPPPERFPIFQQHDPSKIVGLSEGASVKLDSGKLTLEGSFYSTKAAREVLELSDDGFPWQASVGAAMLEVDFVEPDAEVTVNGRTEKGPLLHAKKWRIFESSFVPLGADPNTRSTVLAHGTATLEAKERPVSVKNEQVVGASVQPPPATTNPPADPVALERQRVRQIRAEFAEDPEFCLQHIDAGTDLDGCRKEYITRLRAKLAAVPAPTPAPTTNPGIPSRVDAAPPVDASLEWERAIEACLVETGNNRPAAARLAARRHPTVRERFVEHYNTTRPGRPRQQ